MNLTPIRDLVQKTRQLDPKKLGRDSFVYVDISSVDKDAKRIVEPQTLLVDNAPSRARKEIKANDVLVATVRPNLNGVAIVPAQYDNQIASTGFCVLRTDTEQLDPNYLFYFTQTDYFISHLTELSTGAGYPAVSDEDILDTRIPLPPLTEQKRIASLLARADRLRHLRRTAHDLGESLLQSVFLEMFGDITRNEKGWKSQRLEELCDEITVGYVGPMASEYTQSGVLFLRSQNIKPFRIDLNDVKYVSPEFHKKLKKSAIYPGNVVVVRTGLAGTATVVPDNFPETNCSDLVIIRPSSKINNQYLTMLFNSTWGKGHVEGNAVGQIQQHFNIGSANEMKVPLPPLSLQEEFAGVVARVESLRGRMSEGERQVEGLFESLLAESFGGAA